MKRLFFILGVCIVSQIAVAQCKPTITLSISGCSGSFDGRLAERTAEALFNHYMEQAGVGFRSKQECDAFVGMVKSELDNLGTGNCRIRVNVSSCTGCLGSLSNEANIIAIGQGSSFYSTNPVNEINDWSKDYMDRMLALNPDNTIKKPEAIDTKDFEFDQKRSEYRLSGKMPKGNSFIMRSDAYYAQKRESRNTEYVISKDKSSNRPLLYEIGRSSSDDLKPIEIPQETVRLYGDVHNVERKGSITDKVKSALSSLDERLDWYNAEDGNIFQYMYTRWVKENVMAGVDLWERYNVGERISNAWDKVKEVASDPVGAWENKREELVDGINENKDEYIGSGILFLLKPQNQVAGENAQDTYNTLKGSINFVFKDISKSVDYAGSGKVPDYMKTIEKVGDDMSGLAGRVAERSIGTPNLSKITKPITDVNRKPKEKKGKEIANITGKEFKKRAKSAVKNSKYYKGSKEKAIRLLSPNNVITE